MENFIETIVKLPAAYKALIAAGLVAAITGGNFFFLVKPTQAQITAAERRMKRLEEQYIQNRAIADNLNQYRKEKELMEQALAKALSELPESANIEELIQSLYEIAGNTGLNILSISPQAESNSQFYASVPLSIAAKGSYHEVAVFFDSVSKLKRIVNISSVRLGKPTPKNERIELEANYTATAFRFLPTSSGSSEGSGKAKKGKK